MDLRSLKSRLPFASVLAHYGLAPDGKGMVRCPFHDDRTPSMQVSGESAYCHSTACERHGRRIDAIDFVMYAEKLSKHEAILRCKAMAGEAMLAGAGVRRSKNAGDGTKASATGGAAGSAAGGSGEAAGEAGGGDDYAAAYAQARLSVARSPAGRAYLAERGLAELREVGYNTGRTFLKSLRECVVFGLRDQAGAVVSLYGRSIRADKGGGGAKAGGRHYYTKGRRGLYPGWPAADTTRLVVCESVIDAATVEVHTEYRALALYGTGGMNEEHIEALDALRNLREIVLAMDGDEAGRRARTKWADVLHERLPGVGISSVELAEGEDVNAVACAGADGPARLAHLIEERETLYPSSETASPETASPETARTAGGEGDAAGGGAGGGDGLDASDPRLLRWATGALRFTLVGGVATRPLERMKVTVKIERADSADPMHRVRTAVDLYRDEAVERLAGKVAGRLGLGTTELLRALLGLTEAVEVYRAGRLKAEDEAAGGRRRVRLSSERRARAEAFLAAPDLLARTAEQIAAAGVVGERENALVLWLAFTTRLRPRPLHVVALGGSGTGKTYLQERVASLIPDEHKVEITALSENALYYFDRTELRHRLVLVEDLDGAGGHEGVLYTLRELQSKGRITKTVALKDARGNMRTKTLAVEGPICLAATTTAECLYEDNANRSLLLYLDGSPEQREAILAYQRRASAGRVDHAGESAAAELMRDVQLVLAGEVYERGGGRHGGGHGSGGGDRGSGFGESLTKAVRVVNPYAERLALPRECFAPLRTQAHYLSFVEAVTFYHQRQRERKTDERGGAYVETTLADVAMANELLAGVIAAKADELTRATRRFLERLEAYLKERGAASFRAGEVRRAWRMAPTTIARHLRTLVSYGYCRVVNGSAARGYEYELAATGAKPLGERVRQSLQRTLERVAVAEEDGAIERGTEGGDEGQNGTDTAQNGRKREWPTGGPLLNRATESPVAQ